MIQSLHIANFQSHQDSYLDFAPGLNVVLGQSDSGKTAILRALYWLCHNRPLGEAFRSWWGGDTEVGLELIEGQVNRIRTNKLNGYLLGMHDTFKALGKTVPEEISKFIDLTDINWQMQFHPVFLLSDLPGEVARKLNEIANLDVIDRAVRNLNRDIRQTSSAVDHTKEQVEELTGQLKGFDYLVKFEQDVQKVEEAETKWKGLLSDRDDLEKIVIQIDTVKDRLGEAEAVLVMEEEVDQLNQLIPQRDQLGEQYDALNACAKNIREIEERILLAGEELNDLEQEFKRLMPDICPLCEQEVK